MPTGGPHSPACSHAEPNSICDCDCAGAHHAVARTGGRPAASSVTSRAKRAAAARQVKVQSSSRSDAAQSTATAADWRRWRASTSRPGVRVEITTRREQRSADFRRDLADAEATLVAAQDRVAAELAGKRMSRARRAQAVEDATTQEQWGVNMARNMVEHIAASTDPVWEETADTRRFGAQDVDERNPLAVYGDLLNIADESDTSARHLHDIEEIPAHFHGAVRDYVVARPFGGAPGGIFIGDHAVPDLDSLGHLRGEQPRGWQPGSTFDQVPGVFSPSARVVAMGGGGHGHGSDSLGRHELGHGLDEALGEQLPGPGRMSVRPDFTNLHGEYAQAPGRRNPYYVQRTDQGQLADGGRSELWAEAFSVWSGNRTNEPAAALSRHLDMPPDLARRFDAYYSGVEQRLRDRGVAGG